MTNQEKALAGCTNLLDKLLAAVGEITQDDINTITDMSSENYPGIDIPALETALADKYTITQW